MVFVKDVSKYVVVAFVVFVVWVWVSESLRERRRKNENH